MNTAAFLEALIPDWRATLPPTIDRAYFDAFVARNRKQLEATLAPLVALLDAPTPQQRRQIADEEARMGVALRAARDDEEAAWATAVRRGLHFEMTENNLDRDAAHRVVMRNLATDLRFYDQLAPKPADARTKGQRTAANLAAMQLVVKKEPGKFTASEITTLLGYSGWGGLSIDAVRSKFPPGLVPETFDLIHAYYTPTILADAIADAVCPLLPALAGVTGVVRALEPSAGIGRLLRAFSARRCPPLQGNKQSLTLRWTAIEFSSVSSKLLGAVRPDIELYPMPLERWITDAGSRQQGTFNLIVSNPPYGERGSAALEDTDTFYKENRAYAYFMRRTLDLLVAGGLGVFLVPAGFLTGNGNRGVREKLLLRHHLSAAFRLPSQTANGRDFVPGANVVMDLLFWRSRGGELTEVDPDDQFIVDGDYFERFATHILGTVDGESNGEEEAGVARKGRWRYSVTGDFTGLPPLVERPLCKACALGPIVHHETTPFESVVANTEEPVP